MWAMIFPGQGSQFVGMGRFYYDYFPIARKLFETASEELQIDFKKLCFEGPDTELTKTQNAQPAIVLVSCVARICLAEQTDLSGIKYCAGHSVGEYSALVSAGVISLSDALKAVRKRGLLMQACQGQGAMSALVGASPEEAQQFCQWVEKESTHTPLETANFNHHQQTVLSGILPALHWAQKNYKQYPFSGQKVRLIPLKVSGQFHSSLMQPACQQMQQFLQHVPFKKAQQSVVHNTTAQPEQNITQIQKNLVQQIRSPVLWYQSMQYLIEQGCTHFLELGAGTVLGKLMKTIDPTKSVFHFHSMEDMTALQKSL